MPTAHRSRLPKLMSFDVFGTLISVRDSSYGAFERILAATNAGNVDIKEFWEAWEHRNIERYWQPYQSYRAICRASLADTFARFGIDGNPDLIGHYFELILEIFALRGRAADA